MISFKDFLLNEDQRTHSVFSTILNSGGTPPIFLTPSLMERLDYTIPNVKAFHATHLRGARNIIDNQGSKKQLSVFTNPGTSSSNFKGMLMGGVETAGEVIVELTGNINAYFASDVFSGRVKGGRRSLLVGSSALIGGVLDAYGEIGAPKETIKYVDDLMKELQNSLYEAKEEVLNRYILPLIQKVYYEIDHEILYFHEVEKRLKRQKNYQDAWQSIIFLSASSERDLPWMEPGGADFDAFVRYYDKSGKIMKSIVKDYMDAVEKVLKQNPDYKKIFSMPYRNNDEVSGNSYEGLDYDEAIMSDFTVDTIHKYPTDEEAKFLKKVDADDETKKLHLQQVVGKSLGSYDVDVQLWVGENYVEDLYNYILKQSESFQEIYKKRVSNGK